MFDEENEESAAARLSRMMASDRGLTYNRFKRRYGQFVALACSDDTSVEQLVEERECERRHEESLRGKKRK